MNTRKNASRKRFGLQDIKERVGRRQALKIFSFQYYGSRQLQRKGGGINRTP